jgi:hypothetical protein
VQARLGPLGGTGSPRFDSTPIISLSWVAVSGPTTQVLLNSHLLPHKICFVQFQICKVELLGSAADPYPVDP